MKKIVYCAMLALTMLSCERSIESPLAGEWERVVYNKGYGYVETEYVLSFGVSGEYSESTLSDGVMCTTCGHYKYNGDNEGELRLYQNVYGVESTFSVNYGVRIVGDRLYLTNGKTTFEYNRK